jgi:hypothetical protein
LSRNVREAESGSKFIGWYREARYDLYIWVACGFDRLLAAGAQ